MSKVNGKILFVNLFSALRLPATVWVALLISNRHWPLAVAVLLLGFLSDLLDGPLARKLGAVTRAGFWIDAGCDRLLLLSPIAGMAWAGDIWWWLAIVLAIGLFVADALAKKFELLRVVWWPLCYVTILYGLAQHSSTKTIWAAALLFASVCMVMLILKRKEVIRLKAKFLG